MKLSPSIKVAVVEDDARIRGVLKQVFAGVEDCECVGMFRDGASAVANIPALKPDVIVMDINLPDFNGVECVARLSPQLPATHIIMLTIYQDTDMIFQALAAGAHGYLVKPVAPEKLISAIRGIHNGNEVPISAPIARQIIATFRRPAARPTSPPTTDSSGLAPREQQVLDQLVNGLSQKEIADELAIGISTVNTYVQRIYEKLHVHSRREIIARYKKVK